jgi:hypothetical protein
MRRPHGDAGHRAGAGKVRLRRGESVTVHLIAMSCQALDPDRANQVNCHPILATFVAVFMIVLRRDTR